MTISITPDNLFANIKVNPRIRCAVGDTICLQLINSINVDLNNPTGKNVFIYQVLPITPEDPTSGIGYFGTVEATTEWILALIQDVLNKDLQLVYANKEFGPQDTIPSGVPQIPINGQWDCITQQTMGIESAKVKNLSAIPNVADLGPEEFGYILSRSQILYDLINVSNSDIDFVNTFGAMIISAPPQAGPNVPLVPYFNGAKADPKCADKATSGNCQAGEVWDVNAKQCVKSDVVPVKDKEPSTPPKEETSYFWPIVGGLTAGAVLIGGGYYVMKKSKSTATSTS